MLSGRTSCVLTWIEVTKGSLSTILGGVDPSGMKVPWETKSRYLDLKWEFTEISRNPLIIDHHVGK